MIFKEAYVGVCVCGNLSVCIFVCYCTHTHELLRNSVRACGCVVFFRITKKRCQSLRCCFMSSLKSPNFLVCHRLLKHNGLWPGSWSLYSLMYLYLKIFSSIYHLTIYLSIYLSVCQSINLSKHSYIYLFVLCLVNFLKL